MHGAATRRRSVDNPPAAAILRAPQRWCRTAADPRGTSQRRRPRGRFRRL